MNAPAPPNLPVNTRPGIPIATISQSLGTLSGLSGTWIGTGFNLVSLPDFDATPPSTGPAPFRIRLSSTVEILEFTPIGGAVPNRGSTGQNDIDILGLRYLQRIADAVTNEALHIEPGFWLNVPGTSEPQLGPTVVRLGTIPHGNSMLAIGNPLPGPIPGGPHIGPAFGAGGTHPSTPVPNTLANSPIGPQNPPPPLLGAGYLAPFNDPPLPPGFKPTFVQDPNLALQEAILGQNITQTVVLDIHTAAQAAPASPLQLGGIVNMPFDVANATATRLDAIFWIETVQQSDGTTFQQLQYTQTVILNFLGIDWPHISVATLTLQ